MDGDVTLRFEGFSLDRKRVELRDPSGAIVPLRTKTRAVLEHLLTRAGRVAGREEILNAVWRDVTVSPESVDQAVGDLRRALGPKGARLIRTIPKRGYILDAEVRIEDQRVPAEHTAEQTAGPPVLAVLPFDNLSAEPRWGLLCDGLVEDMITDLARQPDLRVIARASSFAWRGRDADIRDIGRALGAAYLLEGSVQAEGGTVRVTAQLINATTGIHLWADRYSGLEEGVFAIQTEVVGRVVGRLGGFSGRIARAERERLVRAPPANLHAYDLYLRGYEAEARLDREGTLAAIELLEAAVRADPMLSRAWTVLGLALGNAAGNGWTNDLGALRARQRAAIRRAVELDPEDGLALEELGGMLARQGDLVGARSAFQRSAVAGANHADTLALLGKYVTEVLDQAKEGEEMMAKAFALNPSAPAWYHLGAIRVAYFAGKFDQAIASVARAPTLRLPRLFLVLALAQLGREEDARVALDEHRAKFGPDGVMSALAGLPPLCPAAGELLNAGLRRAGLPPHTRTGVPPT